MFYRYTKYFNVQSQFYTSSRFFELTIVSKPLSSPEQYMQITIYFAHSSIIICISSVVMLLVIQNRMKLKNRKHIHVFQQYDSITSLNNVQKQKLLSEMQVLAWNISLQYNCLQMQSHHTYFLKVSLGACLHSPQQKYAECAIYAHQEIPCVVCKVSCVIPTFPEFCLSLLQVPSS